MTKLTFISEVKPLLKDLGFRKHGNYWYKTTGAYTYCVYVQGSQWNKENYYVEIGFAFPQDKFENPTVLHWYVRHRCSGTLGQLNISPGDLMASMNDVFWQVSTQQQIWELISSRNALKVASQYWF